MILMSAADGFQQAAPVTTTYSESCGRASYPVRRHARLDAALHPWALRPATPPNVPVRSSAGG
jgi:hypothetical protein